MESTSTAASRISVSSPHRHSTFRYAQGRVLLPPDELSRVWVLRKVLSPLSTVEAMELLISRLSKSKSQHGISGLDVRTRLSHPQSFPIHSP